jgi:hypothetical protein
VELNLPELEERLASLQLQMERLSQRAEGDVQPIEQRLSEMADQYADYLKRWATTVERHARAVAQLEAHIDEVKDASDRVQQDAAHRFEDLEGIIQREWGALRRIHEEPVRELHEQAASLTAICVATASAAQHGFDRAEARLSSFEADFHRRMADLTRELQSAIVEIRTHQPYPASGLDRSAQWSLNDVTRLHSQLREAGGTAPHTIDVVHGQESSVPAEVTPALTGTADNRILSESASVPEPAIPRAWRIAVVCLAFAIVIAGGFVWRLQGQLRSAAGRAEAAERESQKASADTTRQVVAAREEAARQISSARDMANRAQTIGDVLAAPDLVRFNLAGVDSLRGASAQALWSRSRGLVFSGSRIPMPPPNSTYQAWLLTRAGPINAAAWVPEADGTATVIREVPDVARPVIGVIVTLEGASGSDKPSGEALLTSLPPPEQPLANE